MQTLLEDKKTYKKAGKINPVNLMEKVKDFVKENQTYLLDK